VERERALLDREAGPGSRVAALDRPAARRGGSRRVGQRRDLRGPSPPRAGHAGTTYRVSRLLPSGQRRPRGVIFHGAEGRVGR